MTVKNIGRLAIAIGLIAALTAVAVLFDQQRIQADPPSVTWQPLAHFTSDGKLDVAVTVELDGDGTAKGKLQAQLVDENGKVVQTVEKDISQNDKAAQYKLQFPAKKADAGKLKLRTQFQGFKQLAVVDDILLAKAHETTLVAGQEFYSGSRGALQCQVKGIKSLTDSVPLAAADVEVRLRAGEKVHTLYQGKTNTNGESLAEFQVPELPEGQYTLEVVTKSALGEEKLTHNVRVKEDAKILLLTDKPIYQPGQEIHVRALMLRPYDLKPVADTKIVFEIADGKGNKVYRKSLSTSDFGIANIDFQLASEVNMGAYRISATAGNKQATKTVAVKRYQLPKFKTKVTTDKKFYMPKETIKGSLQADYMFGKPLANAKIEIEASTFDVRFRQFTTVKTETDENGHVKFEVKLPDYFVGQPLQKGDAMVKLDIKLTDTAEQTENITKTYTVSDKPIRINMITEGGKLVPNMENRVFVATTYPDGTPARSEVQLWKGKKAEGKPLATVKTNDAGLAEFRFTPDAKWLRPGQNQQQKIEFLGGQRVGWAPQILLDVTAKAKDTTGTTAQSVVALNSEPLGDNVLLRLNKAIYAPGDTLKADIRTSAGLPTVYIDIIRNGQTLLTRWMEVKKGQAKQEMDLPPELFGSLEVHAYQMLNSGAIIRDSRVIYVQPKNDLNVKVNPSKSVYTPGEMGRIRFEITDAKGAPTQAALGVIIVDEAVYALQEMQPGLEKVYFTLQEELLKPNVQAKFPIAEPLPNLIRQPALPAPRQQVAQALLTAVEVKAPKRWQVAPELQRKQQFQQRVMQIGWALWNSQWRNVDLIRVDKKTHKSSFRPDALQHLAKKRFLNNNQLKGPFGETLTIEALTEIEPKFTADNLARSITWNRLHQLTWQVYHTLNQHRNKYWNAKEKRWVFDEKVLDLAASRFGNNRLTYRRDAWGQPLRLTKRDPKSKTIPLNQQHFKEWQVVSVGPDGKLGTKDDINVINSNQMVFGGNFWWGYGNMATGLDGNLGMRMFAREELLRANAGIGQGIGGPVADFARPEAFNRALPVPQAAPNVAKGLPAPGQAVPTDNMATGKNQTATNGQPAPRIREYFPETMLWQPALITDKNGVADLNVAFADSITTWRLTASASSKGGALGGVTVPLKVFQDFFVDIDLPLNLTQEDEVDFPVVVYNYLDQPQTVKIELKQAPWFKLIDGNGLTRTLELKANEVTSVSFRVRADKVGNNPITVMAYGSKKSDAVRRVVEVVPNGEKVEAVINDRLEKSVTHIVNIPDTAIDDASKIVVKMYPGIMAQVVEGLDGMLRMPGGCFEQTSSSAYPNILIVDYIKRNKLDNPKMLMKAEQYLNGGYQRLLTFERPGGGFDWWGRDEPLIWLSAYGLQEFNDMSKVWPVDRGIIDRTQNFLMNKMNKQEGTWSTIGATHGETIASMGNPKLLLTSYVTWSLLESGMDKKRLTKSIEFIRNNVNEGKDNAYILALAGNALASYDPTHDSTVDLLTRLDRLHKDMPKWDAQCYPTDGVSLTYGRGNGVTIESTALTALAMLKTGGFNNSINRSLNYLVKSKNANGAWGSTQATILSLKALLNAQDGSRHKGETPFTIVVNGKEAARGKITEENSDITHVFDLQKHTTHGDNRVEIRVDGKCSLMYSIVGRHFEPWKEAKPQKEPVFNIDVAYDRTELTTRDILKAKATLKYNGDVETNMVMVELGVAPGFVVDPGEFAEMVDAKKVQKFNVTPTRVTLYLGKVMQPGEVRTFEYTLKAKFPLRAQTPPTTVYEYYTPDNRGVAQPVELTVVNKK